MVIVPFAPHSRAYHFRVHRSSIPDKIRLDLLRNQGQPKNIQLSDTAGNCLSGKQTLHEPTDSFPA